MRSGKPGLDLAAQLDEVSDVKDRLISDLPDNEAEWSEEQRTRWLLAQMLEWHRREEKSAWWEYFRLCQLSDDELQGTRQRWVGSNTRAKRAGSSVLRFIAIGFHLKTTQLIARLKSAIRELKRVPET